MSGDLQPRKRKGKGKKKEYYEEDVLETKGYLHKHNIDGMNHNMKPLSNGNASGGDGGDGGSRFMAKALFLLLLVALSLVVALILVELQSKQKAAMDENISGVDEMVPPLPPPPPPPPPTVDEGSTSFEASLQDDREQENVDNLPATTPLEDNLKVVEEVMMDPLPSHTKIEAARVLPKETQEGIPSQAGEMVEVMEVVSHVENIVEMIPSPEVVLHTEGDVDVIGDRKEQLMKEVDDIVEVSSARRLDPLESPSPILQQETEDDEYKDNIVESAEVEDKQPVVEKEEDEEEDLELSEPSSNGKVTKETQKTEDEKEVEDWSQYGKENSIATLTDAYLKVESLAEDILSLDPQNAMVAQLTPHMAGVLRAMEEGQTKGLMDTLNHIQVIMEDVKTRIQEKEPIIYPRPPAQDETQQQQHQAISEVKIEADSNGRPEEESMLQDDLGTQTSEGAYQTDASLVYTSEMDSKDVDAKFLGETEKEVAVEVDIKKRVKEPVETKKEPIAEADLDLQVEETVETVREPEKKADVEIKSQIDEMAEVETGKERVIEEAIETEKEAAAVPVEKVESKAHKKEEEIDIDAPIEREIEVKADIIVDRVEAEKDLEKSAENIETETHADRATLQTETETAKDAQIEPETKTTEEDTDTLEVNAEMETQVDKESELESEEVAGIVTEMTGDAETKLETQENLVTRTETKGAHPAIQEHPLPSPISEEEHEAPQVTKDILEAEVADIEAQIISKGALTPPPLPPGPPSAENEGSVIPQDGGAEPVPVDEVIPDPIHIDPLLETTKETQVGVVKEKHPLDVAERIESVIDSKIQEELDLADELLKENPVRALNSFGALLQHSPRSARAIYGRARSLDQLAETEKSNSKLEQAILTYRSLMDLADEEPSLVPLHMLRAAAERCINRMKFRGFHGKALRVQQRLLQRFPDDITLRNNMGVTYLLMNQGTAAKEVFEAVLEKWPQDGFAQVHYGFVLKTTYNNMTGGAYYMRKGIESMAEGTQDERFFFHLGDALQRQGKIEEAYKIYDKAVENGMFLNRYQRSLYNVDRLTSQPFWTLDETTYQVFFRKLEANWKVIRNEGMSLLGLPIQDGFRPEAENLKDTGDWKQYELFTKGRKITANCVKAPKTCSLIEQFPPAAGCKRGQAKFSVMQPHTHVHAHTGPTNCRLRAHLGLVVPEGVSLKVAEQTTTWEEGKVIVFDDSWEHEVWHEGNSIRLVLIVDVWHPELTEYERRTLSPI